MKRTIVLVVTLFAILGTLGGFPVQAAEKIVLKVADSFPPTHYISVQATKFWMDKVKKDTGGHVDFEYYPAQQLGKAKDMLTLTQTGVTDIGYIAPAYISDKMPLTGIAELPGMFKNSCSGSRAIWSLTNGGILDRLEFKKNEIKALFAFTLVPYQVLTNERAEIKSLDSLRGMKIRAAGASIPSALESIGAVPIRMAAPEIRESLSRGTIDGSVGPFASVKPYGLSELVRHATGGASFGSFVVTYAISLERWNSLPEDVRHTMIAAGNETVERICEYVDTLEGKAKNDLIAGGMKVYELTDADRASLKRSFAPSRDDWVTKVGSRGLPAAEVMAAFEKAQQN